MKRFFLTLVMSCLIGTMSCHSENISNSLQDVTTKITDEVKLLSKDDKAFGPEFFKIAGLFTLVGIFYSVMHDQVTYRVCPEYFNSIMHKRHYRLHKDLGLDKIDSKTLVATVWGIIASWIPSLLGGTVIALTSRAGGWNKLKKNDLYVLAALWFFATGLSSYVASLFANVSSVACNRSSEPLNQRQRQQLKNDLRKNFLTGWQGDSSPQEIKQWVDENAESFARDLDRTVDAFSDNPRAKHMIFNAVGGAHDAAYGCGAAFAVIVAASIIIKRYIRTRHSLKK